MYAPPPWVLFLIPYSVLGPKASVLMGALHLAAISASLYGMVRILGRRNAGPFLYVLCLPAVYFTSTVVCNLHLLLWGRLFA